MELVIQKVSRKGKQSPQRKHLRVKPHPLPLSLSRNSECSGGREGAVLQNNTKLYTYHISYRIYPSIQPHPLILLLVEKDGAVV